MSRLSLRITEDGYFVRQVSEGRKDWLPMPSLKDAMTAKANGSCYVFRDDDTVTHSYMENGHRIVHTWSYITTCRMCGSDCDGCDYECWRFCSRSCMVEASNPDY